MITLTVTLSGSIGLADLPTQEAQRIARGAALEVQSLVRSNFESLGGRRFWAAAARATTADPEGDGMSVNIRQRGVKLQWQGSGYLDGGAVRPTGRVSEITGLPIKSLSVPLSGPSGYNIADRGGLIDSLVWIPRSRNAKPNVTGYLVGSKQVTRTRGPRKGQSRKVADKSAPLYYVLLSSAVIPAHPEVIPSGQELQAAARSGAQDILDNLLADRRASNNTP